MVGGYRDGPHREEAVQASDLEDRSKKQGVLDAGVDQAANRVEGSRDDVHHFEEQSVMGNWTDVGGAKGGRER